MMATTLALALSLAAAAADGPTVGFYTCADLRAALHDFPLSTTYLEYVVLDADHSFKPIVNSVDELIPVLESNRLIQKHWSRPLRLQLGVEIQKTSLELFVEQMSRKDSEIYGRVKKLAAALKHEKLPVYIRPFSEMNDQGGPSKANYKLDPTTATTNTPEMFAKAWVALHRALTENGFTNFTAHFNVLAARNVGIPGQGGNMELTIRALEAIPRRYVDAFGLNVYARPDGWTGVTNLPNPALVPKTALVDLANNPIALTEIPYVPYGDLAKPWIERMRKSKHADLEIVAGEIGCSNQGTDGNKAKWIREAFEFSRANGFGMLTYFNCNRYNWAALIGSEAEKELKRQLGAGLSR